MTVSVMFMGRKKKSNLATQYPLKGIVKSHLLCHCSLCRCHYDRKAETVMYESEIRSETSPIMKVTHEYYSWILPTESSFASISISTIATLFNVRFSI